MSEVHLAEACPATAIPSGQSVVLPPGHYHVTQALGGTVTVRGAEGLFRISGPSLKLLGEAFAGQAGAGVAASAGPVSEEAVWEALRGVFDPEIPVNIVDLGLIYHLECAPVDGQHDVLVKMTLTAQGCGMGPTIAGDARARIQALAGVREARVEIVWDPQWSPHMISPEGRQKLGLPQA